MSYKSNLSVFLEHFWIEIIDFPNPATHWSIFQTASELSLAP